MQTEIKSFIINVGKYGNLLHDVTTTVVYLKIIVAKLL
jgi:hypothetical protein